MKTHVFSIDEADALLPILSPLLQKLIKYGEKAKQHEYELQLTAFLFEKKIKFLKEIDLLKRRNEMNDLIVKINSLVTHIHDYGCHIKDIDNGLIDFLSEIDGRPVYLCWKLGEPEITYYHELNEGFKKRKYIWFD